MSQRVTEIVTGGAVLAAATGFLIYAINLAGLSSQGNSYSLSASFRSIEGISIGSDIRLAGVKVGRVTNIQLNGDTYRADAVMSFDQTVQLPDDSAIIISSEGLLGGNFVEIVPGGSPFFFEDGDEITDTQGAVSLISLLLKFAGGGES